MDNENIPSGAESGELCHVQFMMHFGLCRQFLFIPQA